MTTAEFEREDAQVIQLVNGKEARRRQNDRRQRQAQEMEDRRIKKLLAADRAMRIVEKVLWGIVCMVLVALVVIPLVPNKAMGIPAVIGLVLAVQFGTILLDRHQRGVL